MAKITINEISRNYTFTDGMANFCSVAMPMTSCWGPGFEEPETQGMSLDEMLENTAFNHFPSTNEGVEAFVATYRGPASNYRSAKDFSYQIGLTLLTAGYDLDVCRVSPGAHASATLDALVGNGDNQTQGKLTFRAKYAGSFGNNIACSIKKPVNRDYWNLIVYIINDSGVRTAVENQVFYFNFDSSTDSVLHVSEIRSNFIDIIVDNIDYDDVTFSADATQLSGGTDRAADGTPEDMMDDAIALATARYGFVSGSDVTDYKAALTSVKNSGPSISKASTVRYMEWCYNAAYYVLELITDRLSYNSKRLIMPGWDDQNIWLLTNETVPKLGSISPLHARMMEVASVSRCAAALLDIPKSLERSGVWSDDDSVNSAGYAQIVARYIPTNTTDSDGLFATHSALFGPWAQYRYSGMSRNNIAPPAFLALMIQLAMLKNQANGYEWAQPINRKHNLVIGQPDFKVPKKLLDNWQSIEGVSLNVITQIPDMGITVWGNSTLFDVPPANYNALQNLSTRYLMNAIRDVVFRAGISITFQYNNKEAYSRFMVATTPILDDMLDTGAITGYTVNMSKDIDGLDSVNLNSVIGQIVIFVEGVINDITIDLIALPAGTESLYATTM